MDNETTQARPPEYGGATGSTFQHLRLHNPIIAQIMRSGGTAEDCAVALAVHNDRLVDRLMTLEGIAPRRIKLPNGRVMIWRCPEHLIPKTDMSNPAEQGDTTRYHQGGFTVPPTTDRTAACGVYPGSGCSAFNSEFLGRFPEPTSEEIAARELAEDYHRVTEEFDRTVCTGPIRNGSIRPSCVAELHTINRFARQAYANRLEMAIAKGATPKQFQKAVAVAVHRMQNAERSGVPSADEDGSAERPNYHADCHKCGKRTAWIDPREYGDKIGCIHCGHEIELSNPAVRGRESASVPCTGVVGSLNQEGT